jgi:hypothetical protein
MRLAARPLADGACPVRAPSRAGRRHARPTARLAAGASAERPAGRAVLLLGPRSTRRVATRQRAFTPAAQAARQSAGAVSAQGTSRQVVRPALLAALGCSLCVAVARSFALWELSRPLLPKPPCAPPSSPAGVLTRCRPPSQQAVASLALQALLLVGLLFATLAWFTAAASSPYSRVPEVVFVRKLAVATFWKARRRRLGCCLCPQGWCSLPPPPRRWPTGW